MLDRDHLSLAHRLWGQIVRPGDRVVDATLGKGRDALRLAQLCLQHESGRLVGLDIQPQAIDTTWALLADHLPASALQQVRLMVGDHARFPSDLEPGSIRLIVYNLGYLPGSDESVITTSQGTLQSLEAARELLHPGGTISCTCYSGHPGGDEEEQAVLAWASRLPRSQWTVTHTRWLNRRKGPSLLMVERIG